MSAGITLTKTVLFRHRYGLGAVLGFLACCSMLFATVKLNDLPDFVRACLTVLVFLSILYLAGIFIHPESDVVSARSSYPAHYFTLPVATRDLVLWPMAIGALFVGGGTLLVCATLKHAGAQIDVSWLPLMAAAILTTLQAILWFPLSVPYARLLLTMASIFALLMFGPGGTTWGIRDSQKPVLFLFAIAAAVCTALVGVNRARQGHGNEAELIKSWSLGARVRQGRPFSGAGASQLWYEWKMQGKYLPLAAGLMVSGMLILLHWEHDLSPLYQFRTSFAQRVPTAPVLLSVYFPSVLMLIPLLSWIIGCGARRTDLKGSDRTFHLFYGTRPMADGSLVWAKLKCAGWSTVAAWGVVLLLSSLLLLQTCGYEAGAVALDEHGPLAKVVLPYLTREWVIRQVATVTVLMFLTWRNHIVAYWTELSGIRYLRAAYPVALIFGVALYCVWAPNTRSSAVLDTMATVVHLVVIAKLLAAAALLVWIVGRKIVPARELRAYFGIAAVSMVALTSASLIATAEWRADLASLGTIPVSFIGLVPWLAVLYVPMVRVELALLALAHSRHR